MARTARAVSSTGIYAVTLKGVTDLFEDAEMREAFVDAAEKYIGNGVLGIRFSNNRADMLIEESEKGISMDMKPLTTSFARTYNRKYGIDGKVFADRFKSVPVEDDSTRTECLDYLAGGDTTSVYVSTGNERGKLTKSKKKPAVKKKAAEPKTVVKEVPEKTVEVKKETPPTPVRKRNDLPSWLL